jgi:small-conductance mechanosensitive channel
LNPASQPAGEIAGASASMNASSPPFEPLLRLLADLSTTGAMLQAAVLAGALLLAWIVARVARAHLRKARIQADRDREALRLGAAGLDRIVFPVIAWTLLIVGRAVLEQFIPVRLLDLAVPLLSSLVIVRLAVHALRYAFPSGSWVRKSERAIAWMVWTVMVLHITAILPRIRQVLDGIRLPGNALDLSVLALIDGLVAIAATMIVAVWLGRVAESRIMALSHMDVSLRVVFSKLMRAVFVLLGVLIALALVGIDVTVLSVFGGALGVGLGFGLQKIAANYVSGFVILLDRSIKLGDLVTIDNCYGEVTRLTVRYVVVRAFDGTENLIPNETVITSTVINHSYSDRMVRVDGRVQVGYSSDVPQVLETLRAVALAHPRVLADPPPAVLLRGFGDNGIDIDYFVWIRDPEAGRGNLQSELNLRILEEFRARGIEIPYPQRDVRIVGAPAGQGTA